MDIVAKVEEIRVRHKNRMDSAYDEWLEEHLDDFDDDESEKRFANFRTGDGTKVRNLKSTEAVEEMWNIYREENKDGGPGSGIRGHQTNPYSYLTKQVDFTKKRDRSGPYDELKVMKGKSENGKHN